MQGFEIDLAGTPLPVSRLFCIGRNYADHMAELDSASNQPCVIFMKPLTSLLGVGEPIVAPRGLGALHHEVELVVAIGKAGRDIEPTAALGGRHQVILVSRVVAPQARRAARLY